MTENATLTGETPRKRHENTAKNREEIRLHSEGVGEEEDMRGGTLMDRGGGGGLVHGFS